MGAGPAKATVWKGSMRFLFCKETIYMTNIQSTFAFIFDSGKLGSSFYGEVVFEQMIKGGELSKNPATVTVSLGDIFTYQRYIDIEPYIFKDEYCTLDFDDLLRKNSFKDFPFCWVVENLSSDIALAIDKRLRNDLKGYVGLSHVDKTSVLERKQLWKHTVKSFSLCGNTIISFQDPQLEGEFVHSGIAKQSGYRITYKPQFNDELDDEEDTILIQDKTKGQNKDVDRDLLTLNFSIREELQISGVLLWKSINAISKVNFTIDGAANEHLVEYPFLTLYFASQGVERIQKAIVELICKKNHILEKEKDRVYDLLVSHAHDKLNNWIEEKEDIKLNTNCRKLIDILTRFYNTVRYARYEDESYRRSTTPEYDLLLELKPSNSSNPGDDIKNNFGNYLGKLANMYFVVYDKLCSDLNIYAYELEYDSAASIVYGHREKPKNLYKEFLRRQNAKKEILYWLMKKASKYPKYSIAKEDALEFDIGSVEHYLWELIFNSEDGQDCYDEVDCLYDELCSNDKEKWKDRLELIDYFINKT